MPAPRGLHVLARLHGVQTAYRDNAGRRVSASPESLMAAFAALRVPIRNAADVPRLLEHRRRVLRERVLEPIVVAWDEGASGFGVRLDDPPGGRLEVYVALEAGGERSWSVEVKSLRVEGPAAEGGVGGVRVRVPLPALPYGYHDLHVVVRAGRRPPERHRALLISSPLRAAGWEVLGERGRRWGVFAPLYALWDQDEEEPTFALLDRLAGEVARSGGSVAGTLPLLAAFLDRPYEPSPYAPVSRLFWNEVYVHAEDVGAGSGTGPVPDGGAASRASLDRGRPEAFDPRAAMAAKRPMLERLAAKTFADAEAWPPELASFRARNPRVEDYARFRALTESRGPWPGWPARLRARDVRRGDYPEAAARYHVCAQWVAERQLARSRESAEARGVGLYLDLPLGVHPNGYDVWSERALFATGASAGAPPDPLAPGGQNWGFPPLHPESSRLDGHGYFVSAIRTHLRFARVLRIDHVMQLHRMFWVPDGVDAGRGVYVRYPAEELYAVLCLESHRAGAVIVGEDLGTVPRIVRRSMRRHGLPGTWVAQFEMTEADDGTLVPRRVPPGALAAVDTHDTPTFAGWWWGRDVEIRCNLGELPRARAEHDLAGRADLRRKLTAGLGVRKSITVADGVARHHAAESAGSAREACAVHAALLRGMGRSRAGLVLATMEDLWLEREPQNVPGTTAYASWRRRSRRPLRALRDPAVAIQLRELNEARKETDE